MENENSFTRWIPSANGVVTRFLPRWSGVPTIAVEHWKNCGSGTQGNFPFLACFLTELDLELGKLGESYDEAVGKQKMKYADIFRFKSRYYALIVPFFDEVDTYYLNEKKRADGDENAILRARIVWQAHYESLQALLDYVDFFFWREAAKVSGLPSNLRMWFKPRYSVDKGDFTRPPTL